MRQETEIRYANHLFLTKQVAVFVYAGLFVVTLASMGNLKIAIPLLLGIVGIT
ncbi:MAG: hypothetical protein AB8F78_15940 [Saprospiraceae bacterium]